ncbi:MAG TPA: hypothetical protein VND65_10135 [Candidatus Binatia bacterium]|nr:hypothetical protein [Candidatus Binatia bacterium]
MNSHWTTALRTAIFMLVAAACCLIARDATAQTSILHIQQSVTTSRPGFPQYLYTYPVLDGAQSTAQATGLTGTISLKNYTPTFSEVLWLLAYWNGQCPESGTDPQLTGAKFIWSDILKNPSLSDSELPVDIRFPRPLSMTGCVGLVFAGGPLLEGGATMSADLSLTYEAASAKENSVVDLSGEYCFGQSGGCQNATTDDAMGFGVPVMMPAGRLLELYGDISDSTFDGTKYYGPLPTGKEWGAVNDFYLLPGGCGKFGENLNSQGFPNPVLLTTMYSWLPADALHLESVPLEYEIPEGEKGKAALQSRVERIFEVPVTVNAGDCMVVIYGRSGNGASDDETQVKALMSPLEK